jgi:hypothetical protein
MLSLHSGTHAIQSGSDGCGMELAESAPLRAPFAPAFWRTRFCLAIGRLAARIATVYSTVAAPR